jgi:hypothetical protein
LTSSRNGAVNGAVSLSIFLNRLSSPPLRVALSDPL